MRSPIHNKSLGTQGQWKPRKRTYTIWVVEAEDNKWKPYFCPDCRNMICQYKGELVAEVPGEVGNSYPIKVQCKNANCGRKIVFMGSTKQVSVIE